MESHEERLHKMIIQSKINETKDVMKRKAMEIDKSKLSEAKLVRVPTGGSMPDLKAAAFCKNSML